VTGNRRVHPRPYFFEVVIGAHLIFVYAALRMRGPDITSITNLNIVITMGTLLLEAIAGVVLRGIVETYRGKRYRFFRLIHSAGWLTDTFRLAAFGGALVGVYGAIKLLVPLYHPVLYDRQLWDLEQRMFGGYAPVVFVTNIFSNPRVLSFFDWSYARVFFASLAIAFTFFMSHPSRRVRVAFADGNAALWILGAWLYLLFPTVGPAYAFPELWIPIRESIPVTNLLHMRLMANYRNVLLLGRGISAPLTFIFGVAAFPSLHVAFQTFVFIWMRRLWISGQVLFGLFALLILIGSMITGWHYLLDGLAGIVMAIICYAIPARRWRIGEWSRLRALV
jgi:hypothetical protein